MTARRATVADVPAVVETITQAFHTDPAWSVVFDDPTTRPTLYRELWRLLVEGAMRYDTVWMLDGGEAVSVWLPPGGTELSTAQEAEFEAFAARLPATNQARLTTLVERFEASRPLDRPHHYLSLLATHLDHRGHGFGMRLLAEDLARIDATHEAAYLESTNPGNLKRYAAQGFAAIGTFDVPDGGVVTTMWRDAVPA